MAKNMVLTYLHLLDPGDLPLMAGFSISCESLAIAGLICGDQDGGGGHRRGDRGTASRISVRLSYGDANILCMYLL